jgi:hypothetical protein
MGTLPLPPVPPPTTDGWWLYEWNGTDWAPNYWCASVDSSNQPPEPTPDPKLPVVTPANFSITYSSKPNKTVGKVAISNLPVSAITIVSGDPNNYFWVVTNTQYMYTGPTGKAPPKGTYNMMINATNASGTGTAAAVTVKVT